MKAQKIMYIPLDERPCNYQYPAMIHNISGDLLIRPPLSLLGYKKEGADVDRLREWILANLERVEFLILSIDMLVFGGILPSRIHNLSNEEIKDRLGLLKTIKDRYPKIKIFAFNLITRVPAYNSSDEEPDYYDYYGKKIFKLGFLIDRLDLGIADQQEKEELAILMQEIPSDVKNDYCSRRKKNHQLNRQVIQFVKDKKIDFLVFPMDDNSEYGFSSKERRALIKLVNKDKLSNDVYSYPGADEIGSILTMRAFCEQHNYQPRVYVRYSSEKGKTLIPFLEDRSVEQTVKYQIVTAGGVVVDNSLEADYVLMVNTPSETTLKKKEGWESILNKEAIIDPHRNLHEFITAIQYYLSKGFMVGVADVAVLNGSDDQLMKLMNTNNLLTKLSSYGGWNTSSNTLGTVVAHTSMVSYLKNQKIYFIKQKERSNKFLFLRYLEDWGYQHYIRGDITKRLDDYGLDYFDLKNKGNMIAGLINTELCVFIKENVLDFNYGFKVSMPWNRMFEVEITVE